MIHQTLRTTVQLLVASTSRHFNAGLHLLFCITENSSWAKPASGYVSECCCDQCSKPHSHVSDCWGMGSNLFCWHNLR